MGAGPLLSWDIFIEGYHRQIALLDDLNAIKAIGASGQWKEQFDLEHALLRQRKVIVVTDLQLRIVFASSNMPDMNGYEVADVLGQTPKIFQGEATDRASLQAIRNAIDARAPFHGSIVNYRKNKTIYHCEIATFPVFSDKSGELVNFIAFENIAA